MNLKKLIDVQQFAYLEIKALESRPYYAVSKKVEILEMGHLEEVQELIHVRQLLI